MTQQTMNKINNINLQKISDTQAPEIKWRKNHGKFIHEELFKEFEKDNLENLNSTIDNLQTALSIYKDLVQQALNSLNSDIEAETARATNKENELEKNINTETARATTQENFLLAQLGKLQESTSKDISNIQDIINKADLSNIPNTLNTLQTEVAGVQKANQDLQTDVTGVQKANQDLQTKLNDKVNFLAQAIGILLNKEYTDKITAKELKEYCPQMTDEQVQNLLNGIYN